MKKIITETITKCVLFYESMHFHFISLIPLIFQVIFQDRLDKDTKNAELYWRSMSWNGLQLKNCAEGKRQEELSDTALHPKSVAALTKTILTVPYFSTWVWSLLAVTIPMSWTELYHKYSGLHLFFRLTHFKVANPGADHAIALHTELFVILSLSAGIQIRKS